MTKKQLRRQLIIVIMIFGIAILIGTLIYYNDTTAGRIHYELFKGMIPFIIAIPAAYLGFCFQKRTAYQQALRALWTSMINSVNEAIQYTHKETTTKDEYAKTLVTLGKCIDEVRGVYENLNVGPDGNGLYPFESLKRIHKLISDLNFGTIDSKKAEEARNYITNNWKRIRRTFLTEFDRPVPTIFDSPYVKK